jgi:hypothetical protein
VGEFSTYILDRVGLLRALSTAVVVVVVVVVAVVDDVGVDAG